MNILSKYSLKFVKFNLYLFYIDIPEICEQSKFSTECPKNVHKTFENFLQIIPKMDPIATGCQGFITAKPTSGAPKTDLSWKSDLE